MICDNCGNKVYDILKTCPTCGVITRTIIEQCEDKDAQDCRQLKKDHN